MWKWANRVRILIALLTICFFAAAGGEAHADQTLSRPRILLVTSLALPPMEKIPLLYRSYFKDAKFRAEKTFRQFFEKESRHGDVELSVIHDANAYDTWRAIKSPGNIAVFWLSHAASGGVLGGNVLQDVHGNNVLPVFQDLHADTQLLALVGCDTREIYRNMMEQGYFKANPSIELVGTEPLVEATHALEQALGRSMPHIQKAIESFDRVASPLSSDRSCAPKKGYPIRIRRDLDPTISSNVETSPVIVTLGGKLVTVFPPASAGEGQQQTVAWVKTSREGALRASQLKLVLDGGNQSTQDPRWLGEYEIEASWPRANWTLLTKAGSKAPAGVSTRVYRYTGDLFFTQHREPRDWANSDCETAELPIAPGAMRTTPQRFGRAEGEIGVGSAASDGFSQEGGGPPLWTRISIAGKSSRYKQLALAYGRLSAEGLLSPGTHDVNVPFLDLRLDGLTAGRSEQNGEHLAAVLGAVLVSRDIPLDEERVIRVDILGVRNRSNLPFKHEYDPAGLAYLQVAADMIGFKSAERLRAGGDFTGMHLASVQTEAGVVQRLGERIQAQVSLGMETDLSIGFKERGSPAAYSRFKFYGQVRADIDNLLQTLRVSAFVEAQAPIVMESGEDTEAELRLIGGILVAH